MYTCRLYMYVYTHTYMYVCNFHADIAYTHTDIHTYIHAYHTHTCMDACIHACTDACIYTCIHIHTCIQTSMNTYMYNFFLYRQFVTHAYKYSCIHMSLRGICRGFGGTYVAHWLSR